MRGVGILLVVTLVTVACTGGTTSTSSVPPPPVYSTSAPVALTVDLSARPVRWERVMTIPFGPGREQLGFEPTVQGLNALPTSFAVAPDGSVWITDPVKERILRYRHDGTFASGTPIRGKGWPSDLVFVGDHAVVLRKYSPTAWIWSGGTSPPISLDGVRLSPYALVAGATVPTATASFSRLVSIDPATGAATLLDDLTLEDGTGVTMTEDAPGGPRLGMVLRHGDAQETVPIVATTSDGAKATVGPMIEAVLPDAVAGWTLVQSGGEGGRWYLEFASDGTVRAFERLPEPRVGDSEQLRHLTVGPDGAVYLMVAGSHGETIYRRP